MRKLKYTQAFTLIEFMVVMAIIMIVAGMMVGVGSSARNRARKAKAESMIASLEVAISMFNYDTGLYPPNTAGVMTPIGVVYDRLTNETDYGPGVLIPGWEGPYMEFNSEDIASGEVIDPWGTPYDYDRDTRSNNLSTFDLYSYGPNKTDDSGGEDDIINW